MIENQSFEVKNKFVWFILRVIVGGIFAYAGLMKLLEPVENFRAAILDYGIFSPAAASIIARVIPWVEWLGGTFLLAGYLPKQSARIISLLAFGFVILLSISIFSGRGSEKCGCFGEHGIHFTVTQMFFLDLISCLSAWRLSKCIDFPFSLDKFLS